MNFTTFPLIVIWTIISFLLFPLGFVFWKAITRWDVHRIMRHFIWIYGRAWIAIMAPFVRFKRECFQENNIDASNIFVLNHLSFFDTYCLALIPFYDVVFVVRSWPFKMFWYAPFMHLAEYVDAESMGWEDLYNASKEKLLKGAGLAFFPEAHRSRDGKLGRFHSGAFKMALATGVKIVPLCLMGTDVLLPPGRWFLKPASVYLRALKPVDPRDFDGPNAHIEMKKFVKNMMAQTLSLMKAENDNF
jgi:1-acyl-sn-glycerol-3-phosphate acyltransferase